MYLKRVGLTALSILLLWAIANGGDIHVSADDDDYEYDEHEDDDDEYDDDHDEEYDDDDYDYEDYDDDEQGYNDSNSIVNTATWNIWTRTTVINKGKLPINETTQVRIKVENQNKEWSLYMIPLEGELLVPGKLMAEVLGAEVKFYDESKILEVATGNNELIFRAGTNVVYDNQTKTPMPATALYMNNQLFIPISVITNGLGYVAEWQEGTNVIICKQIAI
ncbi:copper amine oxidase N-terminal domain-containing protein [Lysinibacillus sp. 54212]|uniref:copper amine oxidase N-terminal domain-containing protein n=1 Tax=Lysinibacillus sp. 54212 TaxID=3119829 RepID=UPI002FC58EAF